MRDVMRNNEVHKTQQRKQKYEGNQIRNIITEFFYGFKKMGNRKSNTNICIILLFSQANHPTLLEMFQEIKKSPPYRDLG